MSSIPDSSFDAAILARMARDVDNTDEETYRQKSALIRQRATKPQLRLMDDPAKRKAARCPRRAGKTTSALLLFADYFANHKEAVGWYFATTLKNARKLIWRPLRKLNRELELGLEFHKTEAAISWPNGSQLWLAGADDQHSIDEARGHEPHIVVVDEAAKHDQENLRYLIDEVIEPSLLDNDGQLILISTPGSIFAGIYYEVTGPAGVVVQTFEDGRRAVARPYGERRKAKWKGVIWEWSLHTWTLEENTARPDLWLKALALRKRKGWSDENPIWRREYLGEWAGTRGKRVYAYDAARDTWTPAGFVDGFAIMPKGHVWRFIVGVDLGSKDPFAIQVAGFAETSKLLLQCYEYERRGLTPTGMANAIKHAIKLCGGETRVEAIVSDFGQLGDAIIDEWLEEHGLFVERALKKNKPDHIELLNGEYIEERCKNLKDSLLSAEQAVLEWDEKRPGKEKASQKNNNCDAYLYLCTRARSRNSRKADEDLTEQQRVAAEQQKEAERFQAKQKKRRTTEAPPSADVNWETTEWTSTSWKAS